MANYLIKRNGETRHIVGRTTMARMASAGWKVVEMWFA